VEAEPIRRLNPTLHADVSLIRPRLRTRGRNGVALALVSFALLIARPALAQRANLSFETPSSEDAQRPQAWKASGSGYQIALDTIAYDGQRSLRVERPRGGGFAGVSQTLATAGMAATRVRLSGYVRTRDATAGTAGLALVVWGKSPLPLYVEAMAGTGASGTQDWTRYEIELPLPSDALRIEFGTQFTGAGTAWYDGLALETVTDTTLTDSVRAYLQHALDLMQTHSMRRDSIDWTSFRAYAWEQARGSRTISALHPVLEVLVRRLGDGHSLFIRPGPSRNTPPAPPGGELAGKRVGYLRVPGFGTADPEKSTAYADTIQNAIRTLEKTGVCGWIVDLRNNTGGNMWPMIAGLGPLLGRNPVGWFVRPSGAREAWTYERGASRYKGNPLATVTRAHVVRDPDAPVAVLTDGRTASSGEAAVVAFRGRPNTRSFGAATAGMSTGNESFELSDGSRLLITTNVYADRTGQKYGRPIPPDVKLSGTPVQPTANDTVAVAARSWVEAQPACAGSAPEK
jgi:carboxyl-terminal processing protease